MNKTKKLSKAAKRKLKKEAIEAENAKIRAQRIDDVRNIEWDTADAIAKWWLFDKKYKKFTNKEHVYSHWCKKGINVSYHDCDDCMMCSAREYCVIPWDDIWDTMIDGNDNALYEIYEIAPQIVEQRWNRQEAADEWYWRKCYGQ